LDDFGHAREVRLRCGIRFDFGVRVVFLKRGFRGGEDRLTALDDDNACYASFGERLADGVADTSRWTNVSDEVLTT
jgi:hypothetical protein